MGSGPISTILLAPSADDPPAGPSVKSQALPPDSAATLIGPAAAWALASVGKLSTRQKSGPAGSSATFFSASALTTSEPAPAVPTLLGWAMADGAAQNPASPHSATATAQREIITRSSLAPGANHDARASLMCGRVGVRTSEVSGEP